MQMDMASASMRFGLNSTIGLAGFIDVGQAAGIEYTDYDFGQALGYWGVGSGPYICPANPRSVLTTRNDRLPGTQSAHLHRTAHQEIRRAIVCAKHAVDGDQGALVPVHRSFGRAA